MTIVLNSLNDSSLVLICQEIQHGTNLTEIVTKKFMAITLTQD
jgi:hypothetical protein